jgi:enoyl-CoA hydratase
MESELVKVSIQQDVATLTIDRPKALNALDGAVLSALETAVSQLEREVPRVLILTGAGEKAFVAGADIKAMSTLSAAEARAFSEMGHRVFARIEALPCPVISAVNGFALGGGLELALTADLLYASENAKFGQPEVNLGLIPGFGGCVRLPRRIGAQAAAELIYTGDTVDAARAKVLGLVVAVFPQATLLQEVQNIAAKIACRGPVAVRAAKRVMHRSLDVDAASACAIEAQEFAQLFSSADQKEGCNAFLEKRAAKFAGN